MKKKTVLALGLTAAVAVSGMSLGFASWKTDVSASGDVTASGKWDIALTGAALETSTGTEISVKDYAFARTGEMNDALIAATICTSGNASQSGTQSDEAMSDYVNYYAIDTSKFSVDYLKTCDKEMMDAVRADATSVDLDRYLNAYYRHYTAEPEYSNEQATKVVNNFLTDSEALLKEMFPDTYQNYILVDAGTGAWNQFRHIFADMDEITLTGDAVSEDDLASIDGETVDFADVNFQIPDSWAAYSITVTNNGTVNASLADAEMYLDTEDGDQLTVDAPDLSNEVLEPGESCTVKAVVKALDNGSDELDASGSLVMRLPYAQETIESAPSASHIHTK